MAYGSYCYCYHDSYCVGTQLTSKCLSWSGANFNDHTSGSGNFLIIDGSETAAPDICKQYVPVYPDITYIFSFWVRSVYSEETYPFSVYLVIDGVERAASAPIPQGEWTEISIEWNSGNTYESKSIAIRQVSAGAYRDFGIDDIFFGAKWDDAYKQGTPEDKGGLKIAKDDAMAVYPNPSNSSFTIELSGTQEQSVFVYNATGNVVFEKLNTSQKTVEVDLNELSKGIYLVKVLSVDKQEVKKIIVQ